MKKKEKAISALLAVFPTLEAIGRLVENSDNLTIFNSLIEYAVRNDLIKTADEKNFEAFIRSHTGSSEKFASQRRLNFEDLLEKKDEFLQLNMSLRAMTDRINTLMSAAA
jgi:hypothetical protein